MAIRRIDAGLLEDSLAKDRRTTLAAPGKLDDTLRDDLARGLSAVAAVSQVQGFADII
jgi:hypothetical protein